MTSQTIQKKQRNFLPQDFKIESWEPIKSYFDELQDRKINSVKELKNWMKDLSELEAVFSEEAAWAYINMTCDTTNKEYEERFNFFVSVIEPNTAPYFDAYNKKLVNTPFVSELDQKKYQILLRNTRKNIEIFRQENVPLISELDKEKQKYAVITSARTIEFEGEEITMQKASSLLKRPDRKLRQEVFEKMEARKDQDEQELNELFKQLIELRHKVAQNAGFNNFRDYKHKDLGRFDYTIDDCFKFHESIQKHIVPIIETIDLERKSLLKLDQLKPYDTEVDPSGKEPLKPFQNGEELINKTIDCFASFDNFFGDCLVTMKELNYLDLDSRKGKAPGGYNYPLYESGVPFIFMNSVGSLRDLVTMVHESGHAVHSFLSRDLKLTEFKHLPSEVAELASMSMELISMEYWDSFFSNEEDLKRAKKEQLEKVLRTLPWIARIDKFQHWLYENPTHAHNERNEYWKMLGSQFSSKIIDWTGYEKALYRTWQSQLHLYEVPFYYIEYGIAQLGAIAMWRNFRKDREKTLQQYKDALAIGYTKTIPEIYETAGIKFDFSVDYVKELADFVRTEYEKLV